MGSKIFDKLVNNGIVDHLKQCGLFSDFQYGFRSSQSMQIFLQLHLRELLDLFKRSGTIPAVALDISKAFDWV